MKQKIFTAFLICMIFGGGLFVIFARNNHEIPFYDHQVRHFAVSISPKKTPSYLRLLYPYPGQYVQRQEFLAQNEICVELDASSLMMAGDRWSSGAILQRMTIYLDGVEAETPKTVRESLGLFTLTNQSGEIVAQTGGPYNVCLEGPQDIQSGNHKITFEFIKSNNSKIKFEWWFRIGDDK